MNSLEELKIGKWYQSENRIFMPIKKNYETQIAVAFDRDPDYMLNMVYLQPVDHMDKLILGYSPWEVYMEEDREYLYMGEDTIEVENIREEPDIFNRVFVGLFSYKWTPEGKQGIEELKDIIKTIRR